MNGKFNRHFAVGCLLAAGWTAGCPLNAGTLEDAPRLTVRLYNYAEVDSLRLRSGITAASEVFRKAGIQLVWVECPITREAGRKKCGQFDGTLWVQFNVLPEPMAQRLRSQHEVFGVAIGATAYVFFHRAQGLSLHLRISESSVVLGHLIAHELGHVLLGPSHSLTGIMKADLKRADLQLALQGWLVFNSQQAARMRAHLRQPAVAISSVPIEGSASAPAGADYLDAAPAASPLR